MIHEVSCHLCRHECHKSPGACQAMPTWLSSGECEQRFVVENVYKYRYDDSLAYFSPVCSIVSMFMEPLNWKYFSINLYFVSISMLHKVDARIGDNIFLWPEIPNYALNQGSAIIFLLTNLQCTSPIPTIHHFLTENMHIYAHFCY